MRSTTPNSVGVTPKGLYLCPLHFWRLWHPPLFIPWNAIQKVYQEGTNDTHTRLVIAKAEESPIVLPTRLLQPALAECPPIQQGGTGMPCYGWRVTAVLLGGFAILNGLLWLIFIW